MAADVKMYTRRYCGYCSAAQRLLDRKGISYQEIDCTGDPGTRRWLVEVTGRTTVPQIFINGTPIGGFDDLAALERDGELDPLLAADQRSSSGGR